MSERVLKERIQFLQRKQGNAGSREGNGSMLVRTVEVTSYPSSDFCLIGCVVLQPSGVESEGETGEMSPATAVGLTPDIYAIPLGSPPAVDTEAVVTLIGGRWIVC